MPYNINPNDQINQINSMFGPNAYQNRMSQIDNVAKLNAQLSVAKQNYSLRLKAHNDAIKKAQAAATKATIKAKKKTYIDAVNELAGHTSNVKDAAKLANEIRNDPTKQQAIKSQGYTLTDYINGLYNASSNGKYRSEREYKQAQADAKKKQSDPLYGLTSSKPQPKPQAQAHHGILGMISNEFGTLKKDAGQVLGALLHPTSADANNKALSNIKKNGDVANSEAQRFSNRLVDSASFGAYGKLDNSAHGGQKQSYQSSEGRKGVGKAADIASSLLGDLVPGTAIFDGVKGLKTASKAEQALKALGAGSKVAKYGGIAAQGAAAGGLYGIAQQGTDAALNPNSETLKQRLGNIGLDAAIGGAADPIFHIGGNILSKVLGKTRASQSELHSVVSNLSLPKAVRREALKVQDKPLSEQPFNVLSNPLKNVDSSLGKLKPLQRQQTGFKTNVVRDNAYYDEYINALDDQVKLLKSQMGQGVEPGGVINDSHGNVKDRYGRISNNPTWYQDLYKSLGHQPTNEDLYSLASKQLKEGYTDNGVKIPAWEPLRAKNISNEINQIKNINTPDKQGLQIALNQLQKDRTELSQPQTKINVNAIANEPLAQLKQTLKQVAPTKQVENISVGDPGLHKLTKSELIQEQNKLQFAANNADTTIPNTLDHVVSKKDLKATPKDLVNLGYTKVVDNLHPLSKFDKKVEEVTGVPLRPSEKTHVLGLNSRGADQISKQNLTENLVDSKNNVIGKPLKDVTRNLNDKQLEFFDDYLVNKHAITRMSRGEKVFSNEMKMSPEKSAQIVKAYEKQYPEFKQLAKEYYTYNQKLGKAWLVDTELIPEDVWNAYLEKNPYYAPNNRAFNPLEKSMNNGSKRGFANQSNPIKSATGSQRKIISPIESTIEHTEQYVKAAKRNEVMQTLIKNITKSPEDFKGWAEIVKTEKTPQSIVDTLNKDGIDGVLSEFNKGFDQKPDLTHGNIVTGIINGQKVYVKIHEPLLLDALTNLSPPEQHLVFRFFGQVTRWMKNVTTGFNPIFSLTRNVFRDIPTSYVNSKTVSNPVKFSKDLISAFIDVVGNKKAYQSFKNFGGGHSSPISSGVNLLSQSKRSILKPKGIRPLLGKGLGALENFNNAIESAPRLAEYKRNVVPGNYDSHVQGLYAANDITTNFNKHGNFTKGLDSLVPYLNAAVQGLDKLGRQFKDAPKQTILKASGAVALPTIVLYAVNHNNPNYQQLSNYVKDNNFVIPLSNGTFYKIPKPRELGMAFSTDIERTLRAWADNDPHAFQGFVQDVIGNFAPPVRTIAAPINDLRANKNFMGAPIVPGDLQNLSPKYQYDSQTSSLSRGLGNLTNKSPKQIDYLIKSYGGVLGQVGIPAMAPGSTVGSTLKNQVITDPAFSNDIMSNFYNEKNKLDMARNDYTKQGSVDPNMNENLRKAFDAQARNISKVRKEIKTVQSNTALNSKDKQDKIRQLQQIMNQIAQQTNKLAR